MAKTIVLSVANQKGGTTVYNLRAGLAMSGKKVLMLGQCNKEDDRAFCKDQFLKTKLMH